MAVTLYSWDDANAPALVNNAAAGSLLDILDACLVDGYTGKTAAGWTKPYANAANVGCYRNATTGGGTGTYYRIDDTGEQYSRIIGYESMTDLNTGDFAFPTEAQIPGGLYVRKLHQTPFTNINNNGKWHVVADEHSAHVFLHISTYSTSFSYYFFIGDIISFAAADAYKGYIIADTGTSSSYSNTMSQVGANTISQGHYIARDVTGLQQSISSGMQGNLGICDGYLGYGGSSIHEFPNPVDGNLVITNVFITQNTPQAVRGMIPGLKAPCHRKPFTHLMQHTGDGDLAGKTFLVMNTGYSTNSPAQVMVEITDTWYT